MMTRAEVQNRLDSRKVVSLPPGDIWIDKPLVMRDGQVLVGAPNHGTRLFVVDGMSAIEEAPVGTLSGLVFFSVPDVTT